MVCGSFGPSYPTGPYVAQPMAWVAAQNGMPANCYWQSPQAYSYGAQAQQQNFSAWAQPKLPTKIDINAAETVAALGDIVLSFAPSAAAVGHCDRVRRSFES